MTFTTFFPKSPILNVQHCWPSWIQITTKTTKFANNYQGIFTPY